MDHKVLTKQLADGQATVHLLTAENDAEALLASVFLEQHMPDDYRYGALVMFPTTIDIVFTGVSANVPADGAGVIEVGGRLFVDAGGSWGCEQAQSADVFWYKDGVYELAIKEVDRKFVPVWGPSFSEVLRQAEAAAT